MQTLILVLTFTALPEKPPWWDVAWSTWLLVIVGIVAAYIALQTLDDIKTQTENSKVTADAALLNAQAVIRAERSWVMVELEKPPGVGFRMRSESLESGSSTVLRIRLKCVNAGKTIAWVLERSACLEILARPSEEPNFAKLQILSNEPQWIESNGSKSLDATIEGQGQEGIGLMSVAWGIVKYRDAFGEHSTTFGFRILPDDRLERLAGFPEYNQTT